MKTYLTIALTGLALAGCASTDKVLSKEPKAVFYTDDHPDEVAYCLANKNDTAPMRRKDGSTLVLIKNGYGGVSMAFTVYPHGEGSRVVYHKQFGTIGGIWRQCVGLKGDR
jgi:uncharacterized protein YcfL